MAQAASTRKPWVKTSLAPGSKVVTEYLERAGLHGRPRGARLPPRRLRLHDLHRQLRPAAGGGLRRRPGRGPRRRLGAVGQPQLRGPHQPRREDELPRLAAAVRRLRARRDDGHRPARRAAGPGPGRRGRLPERHLAERSRRSRRRSSSAVQVRHVPQDLRRGLRRRRALERARGARPATASPGTRTRPTCASRRSSTTCPPSPSAVDRHRGRARAGDARRLGHHRPHLARRRRSRRTRRPASTSTSTASSAGLQLLRRAPRQPRGDGARHVRQHPPAQPARAGHRGRRHAVPAGRRARCRSTTRR